jgi:hypothetical protein
MRRIPMELPPEVVSQEEISDAASDLSDEFLPHLPQHQMNYRRMPQVRQVPQVRQRQQLGTKSKRGQQLKRSIPLQSTLDRIQMRNDVHAPSPTTGMHERRDDDTNDNDDKKVGHVLDMFSTYDALLDHLMRKNRNLKKYVRNESDYFPSSGTYTTNEIVDQLKLLRRKRRNNPLKSISGRRAISQPRPTVVGDPNTWHETYPQPDYVGRPIGSHPARDQRFVPPEIKVQDRVQDPSPANQFNQESRRQRQPQQAERRNESAWESRNQTQDLMQIMEGFKNGEVQTSPDRRANERIHDGYTQELHGTNYGAQQRADLHEHRSRNRLSHLDVPRRSPIRAREGNGTMVRRRNRRQVLDPIERLRAKNDREWLPDSSPQRDGYHANERNAEVRLEVMGSHRASAMLSKLLPEKIPPKIKASRERLAFFRNSRLRARKDNFGYDPEPNIETRQPPESSMQRNTTPSRYRRRSPTRSRYPSPRSRRQVSPDRPLNDDRYEGYDNHERRRIGSEGMDDFQPAQSRFSARRQQVNERRASRTRDYGGGQSRFPPARQAHECGSDFNRRQDIDSSQDGSSVTPSEKARRLMSHVEDLYLHSKQVGASQEQMNDDLVEIKQLYLTRNDSRNDRALQMRQSGSLEEPYADAKGRINLVSHSIQPNDSASPKRERHQGTNRGIEKQYHTYGVIRPPRQQHHPPTDHEFPQQSPGNQLDHDDKPVELSPRFSREKSNAETLAGERSNDNRIVWDNVDFPDALAGQAPDYLEDNRYDTNERERPSNYAFEKSLLSTSSDSNSVEQRKRSGLRKDNKGKHGRASLRMSKAKTALYMDPIVVPAQRHQGACCG